MKTIVKQFTTRLLKRNSEKYMLADTPLGWRKSLSEILFPPLVNFMQENFTIK